MTVVRYPFATMAALKRDISALDGHWDELSTWEQGLLRFAICLINRPRPSAKDLARAMTIITTCARSHLGSSGHQIATALALPQRTHKNRRNRGDCKPMTLPPGKPFSTMTH